ncbi:hypothetical protein D9615_006127 [Tricholomella constricta]|uniref:Carbonic anhydrase n=1 Tax=Tricholomella constricta TaxID=117010 RepID=A0A8H5HAS1_9AGAR|nr:hypothetical protein D9615_006127 [Tricholomella constricta]
MGLKELAAVYSGLDIDSDNTKSLKDTRVALNPLVSMQPHAEKLTATPARRVVPPKPTTLILSFLIFIYLTLHLAHGASLRDLWPLSRSYRASNFTYTGATGPLGWAGLSKANAACSISKLQSPINLDAAVGGAHPRNIIIAFPDFNEGAEIENTGQTLEVHVRGMATTATTHLDGKAYALDRFHFHTPSEHRIEEEYFPMEVHFVHHAVDGTRLVLATLFELTTDNTTTELLTAVTQNISALTAPGTRTRTGALLFEPLAAHFQVGALYRYTGSLTTPPCTDGVTWLVASEPLTLNVPTFLAFKKVMRFNARYTQNTPGQENLLEMAARQLPHRGRIWNWNWNRNMKGGSVLGLP